MPKQNILFIAALFISPLILTSCAAGILTGVGAATGVAAAQEGGLEGAFSDTKIRAQINDLWFKYNVDTFAKLHLTIDQGRVLITGVVQNPQDRVEAVRLAWQAKGVKQVINEIKLAEGGGITGYARDKWITARLRTTLTFDRAVQAINYSIDTVQGTVYIMGVARSQAELNRVMQTARTIPDVKQVVSYVKLLGTDIVPSTTAADAPMPLTPGASSAPVSSAGMNNGDFMTAPTASPQSLTPPPVESKPLR